ncbi:hypothetical protein V6N12_070847 [Hibiscus sabdariffa]|uniref:Uncharacterized protein n=1 Tax=Hibiscus sabdariffa TaxID=183260 RepID=A0ABR2FIM5_9ROSI
MYLLRRRLSVTLWSRSSISLSVNILPWELKKALLRTGGRPKCTLRIIKVEFRYIEKLLEETVRHRFRNHLNLNRRWVRQIRRTLQYEAVDLPIVVFMALDNIVEEFKLIEAQVKPDWQSGKSLTPGMKMGHELGKGRSWASLDLDDHPNY